MENAYTTGARAVAVSLVSNGQSTDSLYHFSKIRLFGHLNNNKSAIESGRALASHLMSIPLLPPSNLDTLLDLPICSPIFGFRVTGFPLWNLTTSVEAIFAFNCASNHYSLYSTTGITELEHSDSLHLQPDSNVLAIFQWLLFGTGFTAPMPPKELVEKLLKDHRYIFPSDPKTDRLMTEKPFLHPVFPAVMKQSVFNRSFKANNMDLFASTSKKHPKQMQLPDAMVALTATAVSVCVPRRVPRHRRTPKHPLEGAYEDTYQNHMNTLADTRDYAPVALHKVLHRLFNQVTDGKSTQPEAGSSATLINLVEVDESDSFKSCLAAAVNDIPEITDTFRIEHDLTRLASRHHNLAPPVALDSRLYSIADAVAAVHRLRSLLVPVP
ncbi:hypothetical protein B0H14DRAFT_3606912 [Mycena olivaceomarginata]|nr:hypothetical protein B0H14DRAFT_3606912 [Mycena olivaceomarginata]